MTLRIAVDRCFYLGTRLMKLQISWKSWWGRLGLDFISLNRG
jgi:hypothetical protein